MGGCRLHICLCVGAFCAHRTSRCSEKIFYWRIEVGKVPDRSWERTQPQEQTQRQRDGVSVDSGGSAGRCQDDGAECVVDQYVLF
jgi:hypothetical protein